MRDVVVVQEFASPEVIGDLLRHAFNMESTRGSARLGAMRGEAWASPKDVHRFAYLEPVLRRARAGLPALRRVHAWFVRLGPGGSIEPHTHGSNEYAGILFLTPGAPLCYEGGSVPAEPGTFVLIPGDLVHWVPPQGEKRRVSLAVNFERARPLRKAPRSSRAAATLAEAPAI